MNRTYYEFFCGGGMARLGLGKNWKCLLANDIDPKKIDAYVANFGSRGVACGDVYKLRSADLPGKPDLAWASFPCQDLSLAGNRGGLAAERSGTFWGFWQAVHKLRAEARAPRVLVLENVVGTLTSADGRDFQEICGAMHSIGYRFGAAVVDAVHFLPQSRPRLFVICVDESCVLPPSITSNHPEMPWHTQAISDARSLLPSHLRSQWVWWRLGAPSARQIMLADIIDRAEGIAWHSERETSKLLAMMSEFNQAKLRSVGNGGIEYGTGYKRTRVEGKSRVQRFEVRFDGVAGCLRTPGGGSSRQVLVEVKRGRIRTRLLTVREAARLMGVPDSYLIPANYNDGYHIFGDGLAVPAVRHIANCILNPLLAPASELAKATGLAAA